MYFLFILSSFSEAFRPANMTAVAFHSKPENYTRSVSLNRLAINLGFSVGPAIGGILATISYHYIFIVNGITCISAAFIIYFSLKNKRKSPPQKLWLYLNRLIATEHIFSFWWLLISMPCAFSSFSSPCLCIIKLCNSAKLRLVI